MLTREGLPAGESRHRKVSLRRGTRRGTKEGTKYKDDIEQHNRSEQTARNGAVPWRRKQATIPDDGADWGKVSISKKKTFIKTQGGPRDRVGGFMQKKRHDVPSEPRG